MAEKTDLSQLNCSLAGAMSIVGDGWSMLIIRDALLGVRRFSEFRQSLGMARNILADRLKRLTADGVLSREGSDQRPLYGLTDMGRALAPALIALTQWGDDWLSDGRPPIEVRDVHGRSLDRVRLEARGGAVDALDLRFTPGPGAKAETRAFLAFLAARRRSEGLGQD